MNKIKWMHKEVNIKIAENNFNTTLPNIIAGLLFIIIGTVFILFRGTWIVNGLQMFGLREYFYGWQNLFLENSTIFNAVGILVVVLFLLILVSFLVREIRDRKEKHEENA
jgi:Na+/phosphate symporter